MKETSIFFILISLLTTRVHGQGWYAEVDLDLNHSLYAFENISKATLTFSGITVSGTSANSTLNLVVKGTGQMTGAFTLNVNGTAFEPYDRNDPYSLPMSVQYTGKYDALCETRLFIKAGDVAYSELSIWIRVHPRLAISDFVQLCDQITITTPICSPTFHWEVSDSPTGNFKTLSGKSTSTIVVTRQELVDLGFTDTYGRKYFRVSGLANTTSQLQPIDIYYPAPTASIAVATPKCHNGSDGMITVNIQSALPSAIDDFVVTLFTDVPPQGQFLQDYVNNNSTKTFSGLKAGSYWVRIENNSNINVYGNCWADYAAGTIQNPQPVTLRAEVSDYNGYGVRCAGGTDGMIRVIPSGGSGTYSKFEWAPQVSSANIASNLTAGQFHVKVSDHNGCSSEILTSTLTEPTQVNAELFSSGGRNGYDVSCHDKADGKLVAEASGGVGLYNYLWSNRNVTSWISDLPPATYSVVVTDGNGCADDATMTLVAPAPIDFSMEEVSTIKCHGDKTGAVEIVSVAYTIGQHSYAWSSGEKEYAITDKGAGSYTATVSDEQGCTATKTHIISEPTPHTARILPISDFNGVPIRCNGAATGQLHASVHDAAGLVVEGQDFAWYRNGIFYQAGPDLQTLPGLDAAIYHAEIRYNTYCTAKADYVLNEPDAVTATIEAISDYNGVPISCNGMEDGTVQAEASGGTGAISFLWNTGETTSVVAGVGEGTFEVGATDANGCTARASLTLRDPDPLEVQISTLSDYHGAAISCADASDGRLIASAKGGTGSYNLLWSTGENSTEVSNIPAGTHYVTATDANGCHAHDESTVIAPTPVTATIIEVSDYNGFGTSCTGAADGFLRADASGGTGTYSYHWPQTNASAALNANLPTGSYTVVVRDENGCNALTEASITGPEPLTLDIISVKNISCDGGRDGEIHLRARGGTSAYSYSDDGIIWQAEPTLKNLTAVTHATQVKDSNGCSTTRVQTLSQPAPLMISFDDATPALCGEPRGKVTATVIGGTPDYHYLWTDAQNDTVSVESSASDLHAGIYALRVTDSNQCHATSTAGVTSTDGPIIQVARVTSTSCSYMDDGTAIIEVVSGDGPFAFLWQDGQRSAQGTRLKKGNHIFEVRDKNNCATVASVMIPSPDSLIVQMTNIAQPSCFGHCDGSISVESHGGSGVYHYDWGTATGSQLDGICAGTYTVWVKDDNACHASTTFDLSEPDQLAVQLLSQHPPSCPERCDGSIELSASGGTGELSYTWSHGETGRLVKNLCADSFAVQVTDSLGCAVARNFTLDPPEAPPVNLGGSTTLCEGQSYILDAGVGWINHLWSANNGFTSNSRTVILSEAGMYWLEATNAAGCTVRDTFLLQTSSDLLNASFLMPSQAVIDDTVVMIDISWPIPENVVWIFPEMMEKLVSPMDIVYGRFDVAGNYAVSLTATLGACRDEVTKTITILNEENNPSEEGRQQSERFIKNFALYPNPNDGVFDVVVELEEESPIVLTVWNVMTSTRLARISAPSSKHHQQHIDLGPVSAGSYSLRLDCSYGTEYIRFIVN